jgi:lipopolysaccharide/colanic/teichoic acid biosynthesis glycosyltransferase
MTGLAQVHGLREQNTSEEKARFDLQYMLSWSPFSDFTLVIQTLWTLVLRMWQDYPRQSPAERTMPSYPDFDQC